MKNSVYVFSTRCIAAGDCLFSNQNTYIYMLSATEPLALFFTDPFECENIPQWLIYTFAGRTDHTEDLFELLHRHDDDFTMAQAVSNDKGAWLDWLKESDDMRQELCETFSEQMSEYSFSRMTTSRSDGRFEYRKLKSEDNVYCILELSSCTNTNLSEDRNYIRALLEQFCMGDEVTDVYLVLHDKDLSFTKGEPFRILDPTEVPLPYGCTRRVHVIVFQHDHPSISQMLNDPGFCDVGGYIRRLHADNMVMKAKERLARCWRNPEAVAETLRQLRAKEQVREFYPELMSDELTDDQLRVMINDMDV